MSVYLQALDKTLKVIILSSIWLGVSIPLLFALFFFSTSRLRRQPMFIFNVVSICVGIAMGLLNMQTLVRTYNHCHKYGTLTLGVGTTPC